MSLTKQQLEALNNSSFPTNNAGYITADGLRNYNSSSIAAFVDENTYLIESASFSDRINQGGGNIDTGSFATTGSNTFVGNQFITGSDGDIILRGSTANTTDNALLTIHAVNDGPWIGRYFNDTFSTSSSVLSFWGDNDGTFHFHNESTASIKFGVNNYGDNLILNDTNITSNRDLIVNGKLKVIGNAEFTGSQGILSGSIAISNNGNVSSFSDTELNIETNNAPAAEFIVSFNQTASAAIISYDGSTYDNELWTIADSAGIRMTDWDGGIGNISAVPFLSVGANNGSQPAPQFGRGLGVTGSIYQSGTFYADIIDVSSGSIVETTGSYVATFTSGGILTYDTYQNVATALQPYISGSGGNINTGSFATTGSNTFSGSQIIRSSGGAPLIVDHYDATPTQNTLIGFNKSGSAIWSIGNLGTDDSFVLYNPNTFQSPISVAQNNNVTFAGNIYATNLTGSTINTSSFATTGSNNFNGNQTITGSLTISGSNTADVIVQGQIFVSSSLSGSTNRAQITVSGSSNGTIGGSRAAYTQINPGGFSVIRANLSNTVNALGMTVAASSSIAGVTLNSYNQSQISLISTDGGTYDNEFKALATSTGISLQDFDNTAGDYSSWLTVGPNDGVTIPTPTFTRGLTLSPIGAPSAPVAGTIYFSSADSHFYGWNGSAWKQLDN